MLSSLYIKHFVLIDTLHLEFHSGMTVFTGETGAGKSILVEALGFVLGERVDSSIIRHGASRAEVVAVLQLHDVPHVNAWLNELSLDDPDEPEKCLVRRLISQEGRSKAFINDRPVPLQRLRELGQLLIDIHSQHMHHSLLQPDMHREILDKYAAHLDLCEQVKQAYQTWQSACKESTKLNTASHEWAARLDFLQYQCQELDTLALQENEWDELQEQHHRLMHVDQIQQYTQQINSLCHDESKQNIHAYLCQVDKTLDKLIALDPAANHLQPLSQSLRNQFDEFYATIEHYYQHINIDPHHLQTIETRLSLIHELSRKHRIQPDALIALHQQLKQDIEHMLSQEKRQGVLAEALQQLESTYVNIATTLTNARTNALQPLSAAITQYMQQLGMPGGQFEVSLQSLPKENWNSHGMEQVLFLVNANPGQTLQPLHKVASGGELSRLSLALQVIQREQTTKPILVFDEVDIGISGATAEIVGQLLHTLAQNTQVFCVTHLAQVAAQADHHLRVEKQTREGQTFTHIENLDKKEKIQEIARLLAGVTISKQTLEYAESLLAD